MKNIWLCLILIPFSFSCKKNDNPTAHKNSLKLSWTHSFNHLSITEDSLSFLNYFGDTLSVSRVTYFLSSFQLKGDGIHYQSPHVALVDLFGNKNLKFELGDIPDGHYNTLEFTFGLDSSVNVFGSIANTLDHNEMFWPSSMGGGYHFMKFEGHYLDLGRTKGYAVHIGKNGHQIKFSVPVQLDLPKHSAVNFEVKMDEWLTNPYNYRFSVDGPFTMAYDNLMKLIVNNGKDVIELKSIQ